MIKGLEDIGWEYLGALLANQDSKLQAKFFKAFLKEMRSWDTAWAREMQLTHIAKEFSEDDKDLLSVLSYREETP